MRRECNLPLLPANTQGQSTTRSRNRKPLTLDALPASVLRDLVARNCVSSAQHTTGENATILELVLAR